MSMKCINSAGKHYIVVNSFKFRESRTLTNGNISWRCCVRDCNSWVKTDNSRNKILSSKHEHKHKPQCPSPVLTSSTPRASPATAPSGPPSLVARTFTTPLRSVTLLPSVSKTATPLPVEVTQLPTTVSPAALLTSHSDTSTPQPTLALLLAENSSLKEEIASVRAQRQVILDHSVESDQRLLAYTDDIFTIKAPTMPDTLEQVHQVNQTDPYTTDTETILREKIKELEERIKLLSEPCEKCTILTDETSKMITAMKILEEENTMLKMNSLSNKKSKTSTDHTASAIPLRNSFDILSDLRDCEDTRPYEMVERKNRKTKKDNIMKKMASNFNKKQVNLHEQQKRKAVSNKVRLGYKNITIVGDSHSRHLSALLRERICNTLVTGVCKPSAGLLEIAPTSTPPQDHCYVLVAGTNDVAADRQDRIFSHMESVIVNCRKSSNVLVSPLFPRYDLPADSPIHKTITLANNYIAELCCRYDGVDMLDIGGVSRHHYTAHGLHLRDSGKRLLANKILQCLTTLKPLPLQSTDSKPPINTPKPPCIGPITLPHESYAQAVARSAADEEKCKRASCQLNILSADCHVMTHNVDTVFLGGPHSAIG